MSIGAESLTSPWDCPVHGPILEDFAVGFIVGHMLEDVDVGNDDRNLRIAEDISHVKTMNESLAIELVCGRLSVLEQRGL